MGDVAEGERRGERTRKREDEIEIVQRCLLSGGR